MESHKSKARSCGATRHFPLLAVYIPDRGLDDARSLGLFDWRALTLTETIGLFSTCIKQADGGECPLVIDKSTPSCGNSAFGCWTCTVIENDKAVEGFIESGDEHLGRCLSSGIF